MNVQHSLSENEYLVTHAVGQNQTGIRLDHFLKERYQRRSREALHRAIESGAITIERNQSNHLQIGRIKPSTQLIFGDQVLVLSTRRVEPDVDFNYKIIFEDEYLFVIHKPANLPVHPAGRFFFNTLLTHLRTSRPVDQDYFMVHRIDRETSGIMVLTKDLKASRHLTKQFADRKVQKKYLAIVFGKPQAEFSISLPIQRAENSRIELRMRTAQPGVSEEQGAMPAHTDFTRLETRGDYSLIECRPKTGRQHQIRVHLESIGHAIVGDKLYGIPEEDAYGFYDRKFLKPEVLERMILPRHALHAHWIEFTHPITLKPVSFESPLPEDLSQFFYRQG